MAPIRPFATTSLANAGEGMRASGTNLLIRNTFADNGWRCDVGEWVSGGKHNVVTGNAGRGIVVGGWNHVARNSIHNNGRLGIAALLLWRRADDRCTSRWTATES